MAPLSITILGAGISGLTCALALRQKGHQVTLLEKSADGTEAGAAIHLGPNCSGILIDLGFKPENVGANLFTGWAQYNAKGNLGGVKMRMDLTEVNKQWKNPWLCIHRQDLHGELNRLVLDPEGNGPVPILKLGCKIVGVDVDSGVVELNNGEVFKSDVIVGADGLHSFARTYIEPDKKPYAWGKSAYRWLVPRKILLADPLTKDLIGEEGWFGEISEGDRRIVMYPCRNNTEMNFVAFVPNDEATDLGSGWNHEGTKSSVLQAFKNFSADTNKLISYAPEAIRGWRLCDMETMQNWSKGRLALIGDAAHPFLPFLGQGGSLSIEDAASISQLLPEDTSASEIPDRLKLYETIRHGRVTHVQEQTRVNGLDEDKRPAAQGGFTMLLFCHNHDEWQNSREKLEQHLKSRGLANVVTNGA